MRTRTGPGLGGAGGGGGVGDGPGTVLALAEAGLALLAARRFFLAPVLRAFAAAFVLRLAILQKL
jgi:hypothetical protein